MRSPTPRLLAVALFAACGSFTLFVMASNSPKTLVAPENATPKGCCGAGGLTPGAERKKSRVEEFFYHHDHIIGTSLDVWVIAPDEASADLAERSILEEIERLKRIFSIYEPTSEIRQLNRTNSPLPASPEMIEVLRQYETWQERSHGALSGQLGELVRLWQEAEKTQQEPTADALSRIVFQIGRPGWQIDEANNTVARLTDQALNLNAVAKGYIIGKAAKLARAKVSAMTGLLLNLGGDMLAWGKDETGRTGWNIGVQDPHRPQDNAPVLACVHLRDRAIATSGGYQRFTTIQGVRHSHILDPRTGRSASGPASATVIADDNVTANALATTLCVLSPEEGLSLVAAHPGVECMLVTSDGQQLRSPGFTVLELPLPGQDKAEKKEPELADKKKDDKAEKKAEGWPDGFQVNISITLPVVQSNRYRRPYVAIWVTNADAKSVRTVTVWGNNSRYFKDLPEWWKFARNNDALVKAVTRATRMPGKYQLVWDGKDDKGAVLPQGTYTMFVEVHREHGKLTRQSGKIVCGLDPASITLDANAETGATIIEYAAKKKQS